MPNTEFVDCSVQGVFTVHCTGCTGYCVVYRIQRVHCAGSAHSAGSVHCTGCVHCVGCVHCAGCVPCTGCMHCAGCVPCAGCVHCTVVYKVCALCRVCALNVKVVGSQWRHLVDLVPTKLCSVEMGH